MLVAGCCCNCSQDYSAANSNLAAKVLTQRLIIQAVKASTMVKSAPSQNVAKLVGE